MEATPSEGIWGLWKWLSSYGETKRVWRVDEGGRLLDAPGTTVMRAEVYRALGRIVEVSS